MKAGAIEAEERKALRGEGYEVLSEERALQLIDGIEQKKAQAMAGVIIATKMGQVPQSHVPQASQIIKQKALDDLEIAEGITNDDIVIAFNTYQFEDNPKFHEIMQRAQQTAQQHVQMAMQRMQQMAAQRGGMPGMGGRGGGMMGGPPRMQPQSQGPPQQDTDAADLGW